MTTRPFVVAPPPLSVRERRLRSGHEPVNRCCEVFTFSAAAIPMVRTWRPWSTARSSPAADYFVARTILDHTWRISALAEFAISGVAVQSAS